MVCFSRSSTVSKSSSFLPSVEMTKRPDFQRSRYVISTTFATLSVNSGRNIRFLATLEMTVKAITTQSLFRNDRASLR
jgi:hypothetical protein